MSVGNVRQIPWIAWRGSASDSDSEDPAADGTISDTTSGRFLLLLGSGGNRKHLSDYLRERHQVLLPEGSQLPDGPFDLAIVDAAGFRRWHQQLIDAKLREQPTFLPVILIASRRDLRRRLKFFWDTIDEFILTPVERGEFIERVEMLFRARRLALAQRARLAYVVNHDRLSGLPNMNLFMDRLRGAILDAAVLNRQLYATVVHVPLAHVLSSLGHRDFDHAAAICASRLRELLGPDVPLAQLGPQKWGVIHPVGMTMDGVLEVCGRIQRLADESIRIDGERIRVSPRIGIGAYPQDAPDADGVLDCAISALAGAGDTAPTFYSKHDQDKALRFIRTESRLQEALEHEQFELWFQPQVRLSDGQLIAVEALVRWRLPDGQLVPPLEFMEVAEATGIICAIDRWVLRQACAAVQRWRKAGAGVERIAVNVSADDVRAPDFADVVEDMLDRFRVPPEALELELTETALFEISRDSLDKLNRLRKRGVDIAVDDFGTGYSSLRYLHQLPVTSLKIDKAFVSNADQDDANAAIIRTIALLAQNFGLNTVAEGIEREEEARYVASLNVQTAQGYLYAKPMPEAELLKWLAAREPLKA
ncbi:MAG TPA: EAL domain-containing protein [Gammaproteobacteria bacterium]|nr:EAL domain-containing protein [Gammaproteobacteria bacterium]